MEFVVSRPTLSAPPPPGLDCRYSAPWVVVTGGCNTLPTLPRCWLRLSPVYIGDPGPVPHFENVHRLLGDRVTLAHWSPGAGLPSVPQLLMAIDEHSPAENDAFWINLKAGLNRTFDLRVASALTEIAGIVATDVMGRDLLITQGFWRLKRSGDFTSLCDTMFRCSGLGRNPLNDVPTT